MEQYAKKVVAQLDTQTHTYIDILAYALKFLIDLFAQRLDYLIWLPQRRLTNKPKNLTWNLAWHYMTSANGIHFRQLTQKCCCNCCDRVIGKYYFFFLLQGCGQTAKKGVQRSASAQDSLTNFLFYLFLSNICTISTHLLRVVV